MALELLSRLASLARGSNVAEDPLDTIGKLQLMEGRQLDAALKMRRLSEPSEREKFAWQQQMDGIKVMFSAAEKIYSDKATSQASRQWVYDTMAPVLRGMPRAFQAALESWAGTQFLSDEEMRRREFMKRYPAPTRPIGPDGVMLPRTAENEGAWADYLMSEAEYKQREAVAVYGKEKGKEIAKVPQFIQVLPTKGEGENARPGDLWFRHAETGNIIGVDPAVLGVDLDKAREWGYNLYSIAITGARPTAPPITGDYGGDRFRITPMLDLKTGKESFDVQQYGTPDAAYRQAPDAFVKAFGHMAQGTKLEDIKDAEVVGLVSMMKDYEALFKKPEDRAANLKTLNAQLQMKYPGLPYQLIYTPKYKRGLFGFGGIKLDGIDWGLIRANKIISVTDERGNPGTLYKDTETGEILDKSGNKVPQAKGANDGDTVRGVTFAAPEKSPLALEGQVLGATLRDIKKGLKGVGELQKKFEDFMTSHGPKEDAGQFVDWLREDMGPERAQALLEEYEANMTPGIQQLERVGYSVTKILERIPEAAEELAALLIRSPFGDHARVFEKYARDKGMNPEDFRK